MQQVIIILLACVLSFIVGRVTKENKEITDEIKKFNKGAAAGDAAVRAYRVCRKKLSGSSLQSS
jgi:hypothetical protein